MTALFIVLTLVKYEKCCFYFMKFWFLLNLYRLYVDVFQVITNPTNNVYLFQWHEQYNKYNTNSYLVKGYQFV